MSRIFTFGCSFTQYAWPTWADIILYGNTGYNFGVSGGGFDSILYRLLEADRIFKMTSDDTVIIVFTTPIRWDLIVWNNWSTHGQVINNDLSKYKDKLYCLDGLLFKSYYNVQLIDDFLNYRKIKHVYGSVNNLYENIGNYFESLEISKNTISLIDYTSSKVKIELLDFYKFMNGNSTNGWIYSKYYQNGDKDYHPRPIDYYKWIKDVLCDKIDIDIKVTEDQIKNIELELDDVKNFDDIGYKLRPMFPEFFEHQMLTSIYVDKNDKNAKLNGHVI